MHRRHGATPTNPTLEIKNKRIFSAAKRQRQTEPKQNQTSSAAASTETPRNPPVEPRRQTRATRQKRGNLALPEPICTTPGEIHKSRP